MLGLNQPVETFESKYTDHGQIRRLLAHSAGLRVPQTASPFEALSWAIIGQQVSVSAAVSIRRKFITAANIRHSSGLLCFPDAHAVLDMGEDVLRNSGFSRTKATALRNLSEAVVSGDVPLNKWLGLLRKGKMDIEHIRSRLTAIRGIGPWTVSYALLRGFGWLDGSLHGDVAVRRNLTRLLHMQEPVTEKETEAWLAEFAPWRALVAAHLWAMQTSAGF